MSSATEKRARSLFIFSTAVAVSVDGAVHSLGAAVSLVLFAIVLFMVAGLEMHRPVLRRLSAVSLAVAVCLAAYALWQIRWLSDTAAAHSVWSGLAERFGGGGGTIAVNRLQSLWEIPSVVLPFVAFAAAVPLFRSRRNGETLWISLAVIGSAFAFYGIAQRVLFPSWHFFLERDAYTDSVTGFYVNRNTAAAFLMMTCVATLVVLDRLVAQADLLQLRRVFFHRGCWGARELRIGLVLGLFALQFIGIVLTKSRAGSLIAMVVIGGLVSFRFPRYFRAAGLATSRRMLWLGGAMALGVVAILSDQILLRLERQGFDDESRFCIYGAVSGMVLDNLPWGVGIGSFIDAFPAYRKPECGLQGVWETAHDGYLQGMATMGLAFPLLLTTVIGTVLPPSIDAARRESKTRFQAVSVLAVGGALAVHTLVDFPLEIPANVIVFGAMIASTIGMATDPRRSVRDRRVRSSRPERVRRASSLSFVERKVPSGRIPGPIGSAR